MPSRELAIPFPLGGLGKDRGYQSSTPQTTRGSLNVVPDESQEARTRGGSRPGLIKRYPESMNGVPVFLLRVSTVPTDQSRVYEVLVAATTTNAFVGRSSPSGTTLPITYSDQLIPLAGNLCTETGQPLLTETGENIIIGDFEFGEPGPFRRCTVVDYKGQVIVGSDGAVIHESTGSITGAGDLTTLTDGSVPDFTALGIDIDLHWIEITGTDPSVFDGTYLIENVAVGSLTLTGNAFGSGVGGGPAAVSYKIVRAVRVFDPVNNTITLLKPTGGYVPTGASAVAVYRDRVVWAVDRNWLMSRQGDPGDYDYGADPDDPAKAIAGNISDAGQPGDPIVALASAGFDYLLLFAESSVWNMRGDPGYGGQLVNLSKTVGCVACKAWCYGESTEVYFLSKDGLYFLPANASGIPQPISPERLPRELRGIDRDNNFVTLAYDPNDDGVLIFVVPRTGARGRHWWFDTKTTSFWPIELTRNDHQPVDAVTFAGSPVRVRSVVIASFDGYLREWKGVNDDGLPIASYVIFGPFPVSDDIDMDGILTEIVSTLDDQAQPITLSVYVGTSAEEAVQQAKDQTTPPFLTAIQGNRSFTMRPRARDVAFCVRYDAADLWAFEGLFAKFAAAGKRR